jgi:tRNA(fMet)-specific endonuclease VapC
LSYLIDTNIAIHARDSDERVLAKLADHSGSVFLSAFSLVELQRGNYKKPELTALRKMHLDILLKHVPVLPFDQAAAEAYGRIIAQIGWVRGKDFDRMIAAHAISMQSVLVTNNEDDFRDIPGLKIENWAAE